MEGAFSEGVVLGSPIMVLIATVFLPMAIWDSKTGRYSGYFNKEALGHLLFVALFFGFLAIRQGKSGPDVMSDVGFYLMVAVAVSRLFVEFSHHHKYKVWLHRQYHKLTGHDDPRASKGQGHEH